MTALGLRDIQDISNPSSKAIRLGVVAPAPAGSLGDQALLETLRDYFSVDGVSSFSVFFRRGWQTQKLRKDYNAKRYLLTGKEPVAALQNRWVTKDLTHLWFLGTDIVDGAYDPRLVRKILSMMTYASSAGIDVGVLGASISNKPKSDIMKIFADNPAIKFLARDPISHNRFEEATGRSAYLVADMAFLLKPAMTADVAKEAHDWMRAHQANGGRVLAVNTWDFLTENGNFGSTDAQISGFQRYLREDNSRAALFFPHDFRPEGIGDGVMIETIYSALKNEFGERVRYLQPPFNAWDIKALLAAADGVMTGRMHAAIATLGAAKAPLCFVYMNKFEGLMKHFGVDGMCFPYETLRDGRAFYETLIHYEQSAPRLHAEIKNRLPAVQRMSATNFEIVRGARPKALLKAA